MTTGTARPMFYLVQREGVYGRGIVGVFSTTGKAETAALDAARAEHDFHHQFTCYEVQSDMRVALGYEFSGPDWKRDPYVFIVKGGEINAVPAWVIEMASAAVAPPE